jgi:hypothetical protein
MQQSEDIQYAQLLNNLQENKITKDDFSLFKSHFLSKLQINSLEHPWNEATYIFPHNELKDMINHRMMEYHSKKENSICYTIVAKDMYKNKPLCEDIQFNIRQCFSSSNK